VDQDGLAQATHPPGLILMILQATIRAPTGRPAAGDAFIQADGCVELFLELVMVPEVILVKRLLDQHSFNISSGRKTWQVSSV